uniref:Putative secreted protein n=1 Tax=Amblyomma cajennense TaxID=34607 RepID=A0A023FE03_AMBCJ
MKLTLHAWPLILLSTVSTTQSQKRKTNASTNYQQVALTRLQMQPNSSAMRKQRHKNNKNHRNSFNTSLMPFFFLSTDRLNASTGTSSTLVAFTKHVCILQCTNLPTRVLFRHCNPKLAY